jgi:outer membrane lipoprotein SlyB
MAGLSGCKPSYSPDTYASNAVQQANKVEQGMVVGVRQVGVSASGTVGTVSGAAAGGVAGSQVGVGPVSAITALGGSLVGGLAGSAAEHVAADTAAFEYIVRKPNGDLVSVTQKDKVPLVLGQKVLVIAGNQARVVPDYTVPPDVSVAKADKSADADKAAGAAKPADAVKGDQPAADAKAGDTTPSGGTASGDAKPATAAPANAAAGNAVSGVAAPQDLAPGTAKPSDAQPASPAATAPASGSPPAATDAKQAQDPAPANGPGK